MPLGVSWTRLSAWLLILAVGGAVVGGLAWRLSIPAPAPASAAQSPTGSASAPGAPVAATAQPEQGAARPVAAQSAAAVTAVSWQGTALPVSSSDGPSTFTATRSAGFADTQTGAALAAVHLSTHIDPYTGPAVFGPTIRNQVVGGGDTLLRRTQEVYRRAARQMDTSSGAPILVPTGSVQSWRIDGFRASSITTVELLVATPDGSQVVYHVPLQWQRGDWRLVAPERDTHDIFHVAAARDTDSFTPFMDFPGGTR
jgi:hypothetical protein